MLNSLNFLLTSGTKTFYLKIKYCKTAKKKLGLFKNFKLQGISYKISYID